MKGRVVAVCISEAKGTPKVSVPEANLLPDHGLEGDAHAGKGHRQVSLLDERDIESMRRRGLDLDHGAFGENIVVAGVDLDRLGLGSQIRIGETAQLSITQRGKVCHTPCEIFHRVGDCIMPRTGLFARCTHEGTVHPGDPVDVFSVVRRETVQAVVLTISDRCSRGEADDTAGPAVAAMLGERIGAHIYRCEILPDDQNRIEETLRHYADGHTIDLVLTVGGTGMAPRDVTPEATRAVVERLAPGLSEAMRAASLAKTPRAMLSRGASGIRGATLIVNLPGSEKGATECFDVMIPVLPHAVETLRGSSVDCGRSDDRDD